MGKSQINASKTGEERGERRQAVPAQAYQLKRQVVAKEEVANRLVVELSEGLIMCSPNRRLARVTRPSSACACWLNSGDARIIC
eukprot:5981245-Pleurochrysis_carterae.AAC.2